MICPSELDTFIKVVKLSVFQYNLESINVPFRLTFTVSISTVKEILRLCPAEKLTSIYKINNFSNVDEFLMNVAMVRGKLKKGGVVDSQAAARIVLHDWNEGKPGLHGIY